MSQKTLVLALAAILVLVLVAAGMAVSGGSFNLLETQDPRHNARGPLAESSATQADAEQADFEDNIAGSDEHGPYRLGQGGVRVYRDDKGRFFIVDPQGKQVWTDALGRAQKTGKTPGAKTGGPAGSGSSANPASTQGTKADDAAKEDAQPETASLTGSVVDDAGNAFEGAKISLEVEGSSTRTATSGPQGGFAVTGLPTQKLIRASASDSRGNTSKVQTTRLTPGSHALPQALVLPRDTSIRGVVRSAQTGEVLGAASVTLFEGSEKAGWSNKVKASMRTGTDGGFEFAKLLPAYYRISVSCDGFTPRILNAVEPPRDLSVDLQPGAAISGLVKAADGTPLASARVACDFTAEPAQSFHTEAFTDENGFYAVKCQPESQHNVVSVVAAGFAGDRRTFVKSGSEHIDFTLQPSANVVLRGRLLTKTGAPVTAATFRVFDAQKKATKVFQSVGPGSDGAFWVEVDVSGAELRINSGGLAELRTSFSPVAGQTVELGDLYMDSGYAVFGVIAESAQGHKPIAKADVSVGAVKATSDDQGKYRLEGLGVEEFIVRVLHAAYLGNAVKVTPTPGIYEIELNIELGKASFEARVLVKDGDTSGPLAGAKGSLTAYGVALTTAADGLLHFEGLSSLKIDAVFEKAGYATVKVQITADVAENVASAPPQEITLVRGAAISGLCTTQGTALPAASNVEVWDTAKLLVTVQTDSEGKYKTESLPWGVYFVGLPDYGIVPRSVTVSDQGATLDLEVGTICHARGRLLRSDGQPHANAGVYVYRHDNVYWTATFHTDPDGNYELQNLFPGQYVFCALKSQGDVAAQFAVKVNVAKAGWNNIDVNLPQITGVMVGRVTYPGGAPVKRARVSVTNLTANFERALLAAYVVTDDNGYYRAERLENGFQMIARVGGYPDEAVTGTAFSTEVSVPSDDTPVEANIEVAPAGVEITVKYRRADNGPIPSGGPLCYLFDAQGRMAGLFFGGGVFTGTIPLHDVVPGSYTLVATFRGCKRASLTIVVGSTAPQNLEILIEPETRS
ncbi:MAG: carboxypeptidase regulatory-like domain-containing protein [Planctomycetes bacterium]|nr:carboxypeptidase regulatory-like domain-containing protein [Planctomycetota bacterium]